MMTNEVSLKFLLDQLKALINETKEINRKNKNTNEQFDSMEDQMSDDELECLQEQFEEADWYEPEGGADDASNNLAFASESVLGLTDDNNGTSSIVECTPEPVLPMSPTDLMLVRSESAPTTSNNFAIDDTRHDIVIVLNLLAGFAQHATAQSLENSTGYKVWKPGLRPA